MSAARQFAAAFVLTAAGVCAAFGIIWQLESRAIDKALHLGGTK